MLCIAKKFKQFHAFKCTRDSAKSSLKAPHSVGLLPGKTFHAFKCTRFYQILRLAPHSVALLQGNKIHTLKMHLVLPNSPSSSTFVSALKGKKTHTFECTTFYQIFPLIPHSLALQGKNFIHLKMHQQLLHDHPLGLKSF